MKNSSHPISLEVLLSRDRVVRETEETVPIVVRIRGVRASGTPLAYFIVLDKSFSMDGAKIFQAKQAIARILDYLKDNDIVYVYGFTAKVEKIVDGEPAYKRDEIVGKVLDIKLGMGTNIYKALLEVAKEATKIAREKKTGGVRVIIISDGNPTWGPRDPERILSAAQRIRIAGAQGMVIGVGGDYNERILADIAKMLRGYLEHVDRPEEMEKALKEFIGVASQLSAKNVKVEFTPTPGVNLVVYGHEYRHTPRGSIEIDIGDVNYREKIDVPADLIVPPQPLGERLAGVVVAEYSDPETPDSPKRTEPVPVKLLSVEPRDIAEARVSEEVYAYVEAAKTALSLEEAVRKRLEIDAELIEQLSQSTLLLGENELYEKTVSLKEVLKEARIEPEAYKELMSIITKISSGRKKEKLAET